MKISLVFKFSRFANGKFAKFKSRLLLYFSKSLNAYMIEIQKSNLLILNSMNSTNLSQVGKLNSMHIFIP